MSNKLTEQVWLDPSLSKNRLVIMLVLADFSDHEGYCRPLLKEVAARARLSERQTQRYMSDLRERGYIKRAVEHEESNTGRGRPYTYLVFPAISVRHSGAETEKGVELDIIKGDTFDTPSAEKGDTSDVLSPEKGDTSSTQPTDLLTRTRGISDLYTKKDLVVDDREERESEREKRENPIVIDNDNDFSRVTRLWHRNIGKLSDVIEDQLHHLYTTYGAKLLCEAISKAIVSNRYGDKPTLGFVEAICKRMDQEQKSDMARAAALKPRDDKPVGDGTVQGDYVLYIANDPFAAVRQQLTEAGL